ncbi:hypothetical protein P3L10_013092 [Capsicum annuum]
MESLDISISPNISDLLDEEDEELEKVRREQDKEWMTLCQLADKYVLRWYMFLMIYTHGAGNRMIQDIFQHSEKTVHKHFHNALNVVSKLARDIIRPHLNYNDGVGAHKPCSERYLSFFKDCIGALDGTHVKARLSQGQEILYIDRKGYPTKNILAVVDFNMCFTFALAGWEGSTHDIRIFRKIM